MSENNEYDWRDKSPSEIVEIMYKIKHSGGSLAIKLLRKDVDPVLRAAWEMILCHGDSTWDNKYCLFKDAISASTEAQRVKKEMSNE